MEPIKGVDDYNSRLEFITSQPEFEQLPQKEKGLTIAKFRDEYLAEMPESDAVAPIAALSKVKSDYVKGDRYRIDAEDFTKVGLEYPKIAGLPKEKALENINAFRAQVDERAVDFDPVFRDDYAFDLKRIADEEERTVRGYGTPRALDLQNRYIKGYAGSLLRGVGMTETADQLDIEFFPTNPEYDADFISKFSNTGGDAVATMGLVFGASAVGGPWAGAGVGLATNATRKYQGAYQQEFDASGNTELAHQAGLAATPGAALEAAGEMLIAGRFAKLLPDGFQAEFLKAPNAAARSEVVRQALSQTSTRAKLGAVAFNSAQEGVSEVSGDLLSGLGAEAVTGRKEFIPTAAESAETFGLSAIIGGGFGGVEAGMRSTDAALKNKQSEIKSLLEKGDYAGVSSLVEQNIKDAEKPAEPATAAEPKPLLNKAEQAVENGTLVNSVTNERGDKLQVDERTAKVHDGLIDLLTRSATIYEMNDLPAGKGKGERSNIQTNNQRSVATNVNGMVEEQLNIELPERARLFGEIDYTGSEVANVNPEQIELFKRTIDSVALTAIQNGVNPDTVYAGLSFRPDRTMEQSRAANIRGKARTAQDAYKAEFDPEAEAAKYGMLPETVATEVKELTDSVDADTLFQARKENVREYFDPEAFELFKDNKSLGWKEVLVDMPIDEYLSLAAPIKPNENKMSEIEDGGPVIRTSEDNATALKELIEQGSAIPSLPQLYLDDTKGQQVKVTGHEGRHRAMALKALGHDTIPVVLNTSKIRWSEQGENGREYYRLSDADWPTQLVSEKGDLTIDFPVDRTGSYRQRANNSISSQPDVEYLAAVESGDMETAQRMVDQAARVAGFSHKVYHGTNDEFTTFDPDRYLTDRDQLSGPGINTTSDRSEAENYGGRVIGAFVKSDNPAIMTHNVFELLSSAERADADSSLEPSVDVISRRLLDGSIETYGSTFIIKSKTRTDLGFIEAPSFEGAIDSKEKALQVFGEIASGKVSSLHHSVTPSEEGISSYGAMNRRIIEILKGKGYDSILMKVREDDALHKSGAEHRIVFDPNQIKSADPVTYDESGNIIPLSQRFNPDSDSILEQNIQQSWKQIKPVAKQPSLQWPATPNQSVEKVGQVLRALPETITAKNGDAVTIRHNRQGTEETLFTHLATHTNGSPNVARAAYVPRIVSTLEQASLVATDPKSGNKIYVARYQDKGTAKTKPRDSVHMVVTKANGDLVTHFINDFAAGPQDRQGEFEATLLQAGGNSISSQSLPVDGQPYAGRFFHGGSFAGGKMKQSKDGSLGAGYYFTTDERAGEYAKQSGSTIQSIEGGSVRAFDVLLDKPLVINMDGQPNFVEGLIFEALGMPREKAFDKASNIIDEKGYVGKNFQALGRKLGYDGIIQIKDGKVSELVAWDEGSLTDLGNAEKLAPMSSSEGRGNHDQSTNISEQSVDWSGTAVWVDPSTGLTPEQGKSLLNSLMQRPESPKGRIRFENEDGTSAPLQVPIDQLNNKLRGLVTIATGSGDISTFHHEAMHYYHRSGLLAKLLSPDELTAFEQASGLTEDRVWRTENYEAVARAYEGWLRNPLMPFASQIRVPAILEKAFRKISSAFLNLYKSLRSSGLPFQEIKGRAVPDINPAFRSAFEKLYSFDPELRLGQLNIQSPAATTTKQQSSQSGRQLASVTRQLTGGGGVVSPQQGTNNATSAQLSATQQPAEVGKYEQDATDKLNIKLVRKLKPKHRLDEKVKAAFESVAELTAGLHLDQELSGLYYAILDNFAVSRQLNKSPKREQSLRRPAAAFTGAELDAIKDPGNPAYSQGVIDKLNEIRDAAFKLWFEQYKARNAKTMEGLDVSEFGSKAEVVKKNAELKEAQMSEDSGEETELSARRQSINDNVAIGQAALRLRDMTDLPGADLPAKFKPLKSAIGRYYEFLKSVDVTTVEMGDRDAFRVQLYLDALLNDDILLGLTEFAKHEARANLGEATGLEKYRAAYSRFGLVGILNSFGKDISETVSGLRLTSINIEALAKNQAGRDFLNKVFMQEYYDAVSQAEAMKLEYKNFAQATKEKRFGKYGSDPLKMHRAGIISKIMQAPVDLDADATILALQNNVAQLRKGFENEARRGENSGHAGQLKIKLLDELLAGLPVDFTQEQFIDHATERYPAEAGYVMDMVSWIADNLSQGSRMVVEGLYGASFTPQGYYLPTQQVNLEPQQADELQFDGSFFENQYGGDKFTAQNVVTVSRTGNLQQRTGYLGHPDLNTFNTNLEYMLSEAVNGIIMDIYTGFARRKLGFMLNPSKDGPDSLYAQVEDLLASGGKDGASRRKHLRKTISDMVQTDLGQHRYINQLEVLTSKIRRNIAPAMLSSLHQAVTQPVSQFVAHLTRRPELTQYYVSAFKLAMDHTIGGGPASFGVMFDRHLSERAPAPDYLLAKGQTIPRTTPLDKLGDYVIGQVGIDQTTFSEWRNKAKLVDGKIKDGLLFGLRMGDMFSAKVIFAAELLHAAKQEQGITDASKVEYERISPKAVLEAVNVMDESINASRNSRRGTILAHPGIVLSMLSIFAGHRISVASATGLRIRNAVSLAADGNFSDGMFGDSAKYVAATVAQSITFSALKWGVLGMLVKGLYQALTPEEDDERHWLYGEMEQQEVEDLRKLTEDRYSSSFGEGTLGTAVLRDLFGNVILSWAFGGLDNTFFTMADQPLKSNFEEGKKEALEQIRKQLVERADLLTEAEIADLNAQYDAIQKSKFIPMGFKNFGSDDFSGALGAATQPMLDAAGAANDAAFTSKVMSIEDYALMLRFFGYGQPEVTRLLKILAKKKDQDAERAAETEEEELPTYEF